MRIFGNNKVLDWVQKKGMADDEALTHRWLNKALETAQGKVEARNFEIRKNLLRFDDVMNSQRKEIYKERIELMATEDVSDVVAGMRRDVVDALVARAIPEDVYAEQWKTAELKEEVRRIFGLDLPVDEWAKEEGIAEDGIKTRLNDAADRLFAQKVAQYGPEVWRQVEKSMLMQLFDQSWKDHLLHLDHLRQGIGLRAYGQKDPLNEYKREAFNLFSDLLTGLREQVVNVLANAAAAHGSRRRWSRRRQRDARGPRGPGAGRGAGRRPGVRSRRPVRRRRGDAAAAARPTRKVDPNDPVDLGQGLAQRRLPLRLGQEVQALPRAGLKSPSRPASLNDWQAEFGNGAFPQLAVNLENAFGDARRTIRQAQSQTNSRPTSRVVKNGSLACRMVSSSMPTPLSVTDMTAMRRTGGWPSTPVAVAT